MREGGIGLLLTGVMILVFLGSIRATVAVFLSIPLSVMITFFMLHRADKIDRQHGAQRIGAGFFAA